MGRASEKPRASTTKNAPPFCRRFKHSSRLACPMSRRRGPPRMAQICLPKLKNASTSGLGRHVQSQLVELCFDHAACVIEVHLVSEASFPDRIRIQRRLRTISTLPHGLAAKRVPRSGATQKRPSAIRQNTFAPPLTASSARSPLEPPKGPLALAPIGGAQSGVAVVTRPSSSGPEPG